MIERYRSRVSGPLLDRIDMHVEVPAVSLAELRSEATEGTREVAWRVRQAREIQRSRFGSQTDLPVNASLGSDGIEQHCVLAPDAQRLVDTAFDKLKLSARALSRILKLSRTIADLDSSAEIRAAHAAEAIQYRSLDLPAPTEFDHRFRLKVTSDSNGI